MTSVASSIDPVRGVCAITGASGYVGPGLASHLARAGWAIREFSRSGADRPQPGPARVRFELGADPPPAAFDGVDCLVHLAYDFSATRWGEVERINVQGSRRLFAAARAADVERIVFVSTIAAFPGARSLYGRAKLEIERAAIEAGGTIIRPGQVWSPRRGAMLETLQRVVEQLPIVPLPLPAGLQLNLVHEDDLALLVERLLDRWPEVAGELFVAASTQTLSFEELLASLEGQAGRRPRVVRLPWPAAWLGLRTLELVGARPPFRSDSLISLVAADADPRSRATDDAERHGVRFRPYAPAELLTRSSAPGEK
jgi:nucleoside-diphosphate-sugar epimerase